MNSTANASPDTTGDTPNKTLVLIIYVLYLVGFLTGGLTTLVGLIMAYIKRPEATQIEETHLQFLIRTFWIGLLISVIGFILSFIVIGFLVLFLLFIWAVVRCVKGLMLLNDGKPVADPTSWMFG